MLGAIRTTLTATLLIALAAQAQAQNPWRQPAQGPRIARAAYSPRPQEYPVVRPPVPHFQAEPPLYPAPGPQYTPRPEIYPQAAPIVQQPIVQGPVYQQPIVRQPGFDQWPAEVIVETPGGPGCYEPATLAILAEQIVYASDAFVQVFGPTACIVPDGKSILNAAGEVHESGLRLRQAIQCGASRHEIRKKAEEVFSDSNRLARRVSHVAKGRTGPNIRQAAEIFDLGYKIRHAAY
jgi:hypothetical protein